MCAPRCSLSAKQKAPASDNEDFVFLCSFPFFQFLLQSSFGLLAMGLFLNNEHLSTPPVGGQQQPGRQTGSPSAKVRVPKPKRPSSYVTTTFHVTAAFSPGPALPGPCVHCSRPTVAQRRAPACQGGQCAACCVVARMPNLALNTAITHASSSSGLPVGALEALSLPMMRLPGWRGGQVCLGSPWPSSLHLPVQHCASQHKSHRCPPHAGTAHHFVGWPAASR